MEPQIPSFQFSIDCLFIYDPTLLPSKPKPIEEDYQDAKLLFYYPKSVPVESKRNQVGLTEGNIAFFQNFGKKCNRGIVIYL
jgi:hypothetical protein